MAGHIFIYGYIGTDKRNREISFEDVNAQLLENKSESELVVHIISGGGDVFEGEAIYNALKNSGKQVTTHIEGTCASIATLIAGAGSKIIMNKTGRFMIHNPKISGISQAADSRDLRHVANQLDQIKTLLINVYDSKTSLGKEKLWELYDNETWLTADQAQQMGFIDESVDAIKAVAKIDLKQHIKMERNKNIWERMKNLFAIKNEVTETLEDGTVIIVVTEDEDWTSKQVVYEDGSPLPDGEYKLASGNSITVAAGLVTGVTKADASTKESEEVDNKIKELEAQLAEAKNAKATAEASAQEAAAKAETAEAKSVKFENRVKMLESDFLKLKEEAGKTIGDTKELHKGPSFKNIDNPAADYDPMGEDFKRHLKARNAI